MIVSQARTLIRALAEINCDPNWLLSRVNARLACDMEDNRFVTAVSACISPQGHVLWWSAGHGPIFLRRSQDHSVEMLNPQSPPLGVDPDLAAEPPESFDLAPGGQLYILSDGIFEAPNEAGTEQFGLERCTELFDRCATQSPAELLACIRQTMIDWQGHEEPADDQTVVIIQRANV